MKLILLLVTWNLSTLAHSAVIDSSNHIRFWRGYKQDTVGHQQFIDNITSVLMPMTVEVGAGKGLIGYLPSVLPENKPSFLPDEIAIISYETLEKYKTLTQTEEWKIYGPLHYKEGYFSKVNKEGRASGSLVVEEFIEEKYIFDKAPLALKVSLIDGHLQQYDNDIQFLGFISGADKNECINTFLGNAKSKILKQDGFMGVTVLYDVDYLIVISSRLENSDQSLLLDSNCFQLLYKDSYLNQHQMENHPSSVNFQF